ncbi:hypothetical protein EKO27_g6368 [Xylaria grammica]|uniref:FAD-binding PCMH-type domain-containing protein n=1 Tax=Xylaria grammica TaxID=363999 RepID=A0A439D2R4_9PEZI|nr:hypothetical protein EKO27_g6368 [Xylaria grammica]
MPRWPRANDEYPPRLRSFLRPHVDTSRVSLRSILLDPELAWSDQTTITFPNSAGFVEATERWTVFEAPTYQAALQPATEADVIKAVKLATRFNIPFLATGGRHSYTTTLGKLHDGLAIDLSQLDTVEIDKVAETVTVGPGVIINDILDPLFDAGFIIRTAFCPGVIGVTIGGGVGRFAGIFGLMLDALVSVRIVTATGNLIEASQTSNPELFWAIRGAGANFGIITSAIYKVHPLSKVPNDGRIFTVDFQFPNNMSSPFYKAVESLNDKLPPELAGLSFVNYNSTTNQAQVVSNWVYLGTEKNAREALAPIFELNVAPTSAKIVTWNKLINSPFNNDVATLCQRGGLRDIYSANFRNYSAATYDTLFDKMSKFYDKYPGGRNSALQLEFYPNQAMKRVPTTATAWPWRDATGYMNVAAIWSDGDQYTAEAAKSLALDLRDEVAATAGYPDLSVFINYAHGDEKLEQIYGVDNSARLASLKKKWDPNHVFSFNNGLPTQYH